MTTAPPTNTQAPKTANIHPDWCDRAWRMTNPASQATGYRSGVGGEHQSAPFPLNLAVAHWLPAPVDAAWLTEACAPWQGEPHPRVQVGDAHVQLPAEEAGQLLDTLSPLLGPALLAVRVSR